MLHLDFMRDGNIIIHATNHWKKVLLDKVFKVRKKLYGT
jgi:hypothetical protein